MSKSHEKRLGVVGLRSRTHRVSKPLLETRYGCRVTYCSKFAPPWRDAIQMRVLYRLWRKIRGGEKSSLSNAPEQFPDELPEINPLLRDEVKRQLAAIPKHEENVLLITQQQRKITYHWYSASITSIGSFLALTFVWHS